MNEDNVEMALVDSDLQTRRFGRPYTALSTLESAQDIHPPERIIIPSNKYSIFDVIGTWHIFNLWILPFLAALLVALIPNDWKYNTTTVPLLPSRDIDGRISLNESHFGMITSNFHVIHKTRDKYYELHTDVNILAYVKSYVQIPLLSVSIDLCNSSSDSLLSVSQLSGSIAITSRLFDHKLISNASVPYSAVLSNDTVALSDFTPYSLNCSLLDPLNQPNKMLMMPLSMHTFDAPHVLTGDNHWMAFHFEAMEIPNTLFSSPEYVIVTHNGDYNAFISIWSFVMCLFTLLYLFYAVGAIVAHTWQQTKHKHSTPSSVDENNTISSRTTACLSRFCLIFGEISTEQYICTLLLLCLFFWQNPFRSSYVLYHYWYEGVPSNSGLLLTGLSSALSYFGILCLLALYISSLKFNKLVNAGSVPSSPDINRAMQHLTRTSIERDPLVGSVGTAHSSSDRMSYGSANQSPLYASSHSTSRSRLQPSTAAAYESYYHSQFWLYSSTQQWTDRYRDEFNRMEAAEASRRNNEEEQRHLLLNYTLNKLFLLLGTWLLVIVYWMMKFPELCKRVFTISNSSSDDSVAYRVCYTLMEYSLIVISLVWIKILLNGLYVTALKLNKSHYLSDRFHQIAYTLVVSQINLGLVVFLICLIWNLALMGVFESGYLLYGRTSVVDWIVYSVRWLNYEGGLHALISAAPLSPPSMSLFMFVSCLIYSIVYITLPVSINLVGDNEDMEKIVGENRSYYVNLEKYDHMRAFNIVHKQSVSERRVTHQHLKKLLIEHKYQLFMKRYVAWKSVTRRSNVFCLETACTLLEASYQAYFPLKRGTIAAAGPLLSRKNSEQSPMQHIDTKFNYKVSPAQSTNATNTPIQLVGGGPCLDLSRLDLELSDTFQDESVSTFGFLGLQYRTLGEDHPTGDSPFPSMPRELSSVVVAFRGSTAANFIIDFKFALIPLPELKHSRAYFVNILRNIENNSVPVTTSSTATKKETEEVVDVDLELGLDFSGKSYQSTLSQSKSHHDFTEMLDALENGERGGEVDEHSRKYYQINTNNKDDENTEAYDATVGNKTIHDSPPQSVMRRMKSVGKAIPLVKEGFPRVHAGFWQAYASIREQMLIAVVRTISQHRKQYYSQSRDDGLSGSEADLSVSDNETHTGIELTHAHCHHRDFSSTSSKHHHIVVNDIVLDLNEIKPLQINFTGHSLGGTMASLAALDISTNMSRILEALCYCEYFKPSQPTTENISDTQVNDFFLRKGLSNLSFLRTWVAPELSVYTYGCPRIGNLAFMQLMKNTVSTNYRVQLNGDLVPMVPKIPGYYYHSGVNVVIDEEERGSLIVKPSLVEQWMLRKTTGSLLNHSLDKYRDCLESCFEHHELKEYLSKEFVAASQSQQQVGLQQGPMSVETKRESLGEGHKRWSSGGKTTTDLPDWLISDR